MELGHMAKEMGDTHAIAAREVANFVLLSCGGTDLVKIPRACYYGQRDYYLGLATVMSSYVRMMAAAHPERDVQPMVAQ